MDWRAHLAAAPLACPEALVLLATIIGVLAASARGCRHGAARHAMRRTPAAGHFALASGATSSPRTLVAGQPLWAAFSHRPRHFRRPTRPSCVSAACVWPARRLLARRSLAQPSFLLPARHLQREWRATSGGKPAAHKEGPLATSCGPLGAPPNCRCFIWASFGAWHSLGGLSVCASVCLCVCDCLWPPGDSGPALSWPPLAARHSRTLMAPARPMQARRFPQAEERRCVSSSASQECQLAWRPTRRRTLS